MEPFASQDAERSLVSYLASIHLMPYLYDVTHKASLEGSSCLFSLAECFPEDAVCATLEDEYMIGSQLLVIPVHQPNALMEYYLPQGIWTNYLSGEQYQGGRWMNHMHPSSRPILFVRENTILPISVPEVPGYPRIQFCIYALQNKMRINGSFYDQYTSKTWHYAVRRMQQQITISSQAGIPYSFRLIHHAGHVADHAFLLEEGDDTIIHPDTRTAILSVQLT